MRNTAAAMEGQSTSPALKVCPRCAAATRTGSETCPECGRRYRRRRWPAVGVVVVALAFAAGYGGRELLSGSDDAVTEITVDQAKVVPLGISRAQLSQRLGDASPVAEQAQSDGHGTCFLYDVALHPSNVWVFCFSQKDKLVSSTSAPV